jgi:2-methylcitrate dehydratase PrpD
LRPENLVLDLMGSMIGSKKIESSRMATELALELGGPEESTVFGRGRKVSAPNAAFANAIQGYAFDFADDHNESNAHPSVATIPASLALGERSSRPSRWATRWSVAWAPPSWARPTTRGFIPPAPAGPLAPRSRRPSC